VSHSTPLIILNTVVGPGRAGRPVFLQTLRDLGVVEGEFQDVVGRTCSGPRHDLICGKGSTSISENVSPQELPVAILFLEPDSLRRSDGDY
jgi:hypothetical protein